MQERAETWSEANLEQKGNLKVALTFLRRAETGARGQIEKCQKKEVQPWRAAAIRTIGSDLRRGCAADEVTLERRLDGIRRGARIFCINFYCRPQKSVAERLPAWRENLVGDRLTLENCRAVGFRWSRG
jgi:hypothetical protein